MQRCNRVTEISDKLDHESEITLDLRVESNHGFEGSSKANPITVIDIIREYRGNSNGYARAYCMRWGGFAHPPAHGVYLDRRVVYIDSQAFEQELHFRE